MRLRQYPSKEQFIELAQSANVIPVALETLADLDTPVSILSKIYPRRGPVFLFESVEGGENWGRYSFMGVSAHSQVRVFNDRVEVQRGDQTRLLPHTGSPFEQLKTFMAAFRPARVPGMPRFWGGLVGNLSYEAVSFIERIPHRLDPGLPMARFFMPDELLIFDNVRNTLQLVAIAYLADGDDPAVVYDRCRQRLEALNEKVNAPVVVPAVETPSADLEIEAQVTPEAFRQRVKRVKQYIRAGDIIQAVISQPFTCPAAVDPITLYRAQRYVNPSPYMFFLHLDDTILVGSSPETMVRLENRVATLRPIAGTRPRGDSEQADRRLADDLLKDEKERAEHLMLVDLGRNDLGRVAQTGSVQVTDLMVIERYSHVMHLVSNIVCDLKPARDAWDLLAATFPAGTLSGAPKIRAMEIIAELEQSPRDAYGGAVGYISFDGNMDMAITIRTACIDPSGLTVRAGAGIVADSDPEAERMETVNKARAIGRALKIVSQS